MVSVRYPQCANMLRGGSTMSLSRKLRQHVGAAVFAAVAVIGTPSTAEAYLAPGSLLGSEFGVGPTTPGKWGGAAMGTPGGTVTWSLMATGTSCAAESVGCVITALADFMPGGYLAQIQAAFSAWSAVANIQFMQVADDGAAFDAATTSGDIRLGGHVFDGPSGTLAHAFYPPANGFTAAGDIHFDIADTWKIGFGGSGFDIFQVAAHEIGHAIGLDHTGVAGSLLNPFYSEAFAGPQADDIAGAQFIYGAPLGVPEPGTLVLVGLALTLTASMRRRAVQTA